ncbi:molybdopterin-binding protein [Methylobacterium sp. DB1607]|nr:molybdopterin-binding protein [Methylobacterium sp. DB1607]
MSKITRRRLVLGSSTLGLGGALGGLLGGCELIENGPRRPGLYGLSDTLTLATQRFLLRDQPLVREFGPEAISAVFPTINTTDPDDPAYRRSKAAGFSDWRLPVSGFVERPTAFTLAELRAMPARTQITLHACEQGWSAIGGWTGVPLSHVLASVGLKPEARFIVIRTVDGWWDTYDLFDALHPQTILAYGMNGRDLPVAHGAPVRLRVERQLGYKSLKYLASIEATDRVDGLGQGRGSMVSELGFSWYAGI